MYQSVAGNYYDLLNFFESGNFGKLHRCFNSVVSGLRLGDKEDAYLDYRWRVCDYLRKIGLLEIDFDSNDNQTWMTGPCYLVKSESSKYRCIAGSYTIQKFVDSTNSRKVKYIESGFQKKYFEKKIFPAFPEASFSEADAKYLSSDLGCLLIDHPSEAIARCLPSIKNIVSGFTEEMDSFLFDSELDVFCFDSKDFGWKKASESSLVYSSFYRKRRVEGNFDYFLVVSKADSIRKIRIRSREWALIIASEFIKEKLSVTFNEEELTLTVPVGLSLPVQLARVLVACSFSLPLKNDYGQLVYSQITRSIVSIFQNKFPSIDIKEEK